MYSYILIIDLKNTQNHRIYCLLTFGFTFSTITSNTINPSTYTANKVMHHTVKNRNNFFDFFSLFCFRFK